MGNPLKCIALAATVSGMLALSAAPAQAEIWGTYDTRDGGVALRTGAATSYTLLGRGYADQKWSMNYVIEGQSINGNPYWINLDHYLANGSFWKTAFASSDYLNY